MNKYMEEDKKKEGVDKPAEDKPKKKKTSAKKKATKKASAKKKVSSKTKRVAVEEKKEVKSDEKKPMMTFTEKKQSPKKKRGSKAGLILVILLILIILAGAWYQTQQTTEINRQETTGLRQEVNSEVGAIKDRLETITKELEEAKKQAEVVDMKTYTNALVGVTFSYPASLGDVVESLEEVDGKEKETKVKLLSLTFSGNPDIWLVASTGEMKEPQPDSYDGLTADLRTLCASPIEVTKEGYCDQVTSAGVETVEMVKVLSDGKSINNVVKMIPLNLVTEFKGLSINLNLGTPPVTGRSLFKPSTDEQKEASLDKFLRNLIKEEGLSLITKENVEQFAALVGGIQFNQPE